jgi:predicted nuclease of predicted toxin-antitoxin system
VKLIIDMNLSPRWVGVLASVGIEAAHWSTVGAKNAPDSEIMAYARANNHVVLTHDLDFSAILAAGHGKKPSVVQIRAEDVSPETITVKVAQATRESPLARLWERGRGRGNGHRFHHLGRLSGAMTVGKNERPRVAGRLAGRQGNHGHHDDPRATQP